jgi:hypothetical protein
MLRRESSSPGFAAEAMAVLTDQRRRQSAPDDIHGLDTGEDRETAEAERMPHSSLCRHVEETRDSDVVGRRCAQGV